MADRNETRLRALAEELRKAQANVRLHLALSAMPPSAPARCRPPTSGRRARSSGPQTNAA